MISNASTANNSEANNTTADDEEVEAERPRKKGGKRKRAETEEKEEEPEKEAEDEEKEEEKEEEEPPPPPAPEKKEKKAGGKGKKEKKKYVPKAERDLTPCQIVIKEMESSDDSWPFLFPVNAKQFPTYKKIVRNPMDLNTIRRRLEGGGYATRDEFCDDVRLIFANCELFNEDDSPVGKAGHAMRHLFDTKWPELLGGGVNGVGK